ncbi:Paired amphipathic helix protein Sin3a [Papilio xuthus]|uniref:Paired amphipathic helix protein Sin3a n=1 Tax=Papilio xuthus TaxID=66420 RepID=A0A0N1IB80_PAPXU|nr:Paired amphipathic helix protein Sin3a [Papilio xuthus]
MSVCAGVSSSGGVGVGVGGMVPVGGGFARASRPAAPVINYHLKAGVQYGAHKPPAQQPPQPPQPPRLRVAHAPTPLGRQSPGASGGVGGGVAGVAPGGAAGGPGGAPGGGVGGAPGAQFQRLKVEDALSYLDQVKFKFSTQPQVYNDFLDIMKEFKSQTIDTPGVIKRVSNLFKGHPELIVGFNTFLPPGYKIEVQSNGQVSVSMPSPTGLGGVGVGVGVGGVGVGVGSVGGVSVASVSGVGMGGGMMLGVTHSSQPQLLHLLPVQAPVGGAIVHNMTVSAPSANALHHISQAHQQIEAASIHHNQGCCNECNDDAVWCGAGSGGGAHAAAAGQPVEFNHAIEYVNKIKSRFSRQPDKYKRFLEILHAYQRGHRDVKEPQARQQTEQEVYSQALKHPTSVSAPAPPPQHHHLKRSPSFTSSSQIGDVGKLMRGTEAGTPAGSGAPPSKKPRCISGTPPGAGGAGGAGGVPALRDVSYAEAAKLATAQDYSFFDRARKALRSQQVYDNFLRYATPHAPSLRMQNCNVQ